MESLGKTCFFRDKTMNLNEREIFFLKNRGDFREIFKNHCSNLGRVINSSNNEKSNPGPLSKHSCFDSESILQPENNKL